jgi:hypothetical protein
MSENDKTDREQVPVADVIAGDWILPPDEDCGEPMQLLWRTGQRSPNGEMGWSFKTSAGLRHFDHDAWVYRLTSTQRPGAVDIDSVDDEIPVDADSSRALGEVIGAEPEVTRRTEALDVAPAAALARQLAAERTMMRSIVRGIITAMPLTILFTIGLIGLAISDTQPWYVWIGLGTGIGTYAAGFFGTCAGVMLSAHLLDDLDEDAMHESTNDLR